MRPAFLARMALIAALVVAAGCSDNKGRIEATTWTTPELTTKSEEPAPGAKRLQFGKDGHLFYTVLGKLYRGYYTLGMGPAVTFTLEQDLDGRKIHPHKIVIEGEQLRLTSADGSEVTFVKVN